jgi:hypothetical protein
VYALWLASNAVAAVLLARLWTRRILPWFCSLLAAMLAQVAILALVPERTRTFVFLWTATEVILVFLEAASVLELTALLLRGRLNTTLARLRWFGVGIWILSFGAAVTPLMSKTGYGWGIAFAIARTRGFLACGMLVFLTIAAWVLVRQPVPVLRGLVLQGRFLALNFGIMAISMFGATYLPRDRYAFSQILLLGGTALLFAGWTKALWRAPVMADPLEIDQEAARQASEDYEEFRDKIRSLRDGK